MTNDKSSQSADVAKQGARGKGSASQAPRQLSLPIRLDDDATFANFYAEAGSPSEQALNALKDMAAGAGESAIYLWGAPSSGVSHLLQGVCQAADAQGLSAQYLPLSAFITEETSRTNEAFLLMDGLDELDLVCLDDVQLVAGRGEWEAQLFHLINRMRDRGRAIVFGGRVGPRELEVKLADLKSRLNWGLVLRLQSLDDSQMVAALQLRARERGLDIGDDVARFILHRIPREPQRVFSSLQQLDQASMEQQRRITIPFVKEILNL